MTDTERIEAIRQETWKQEEWSDRFRGPHKVWVEKRRLTHAEWELLAGILSKEELVVIPSTSMFGFQHAITIYKWTNAPPGLDEQVAPILQVVSGQLPWAEGPDQSHGRQPANAWEIFCKFTHTAKQEQYRKFLKWDIPLDQWHYDY